MIQVEQIGQRTVLPFDDLDIQFPQEPADSQPEIVADHDNALDACAVALTQSMDQFLVLIRTGMQPLFELIDDQ